MVLFRKKKKEKITKLIGKMHLKEDHITYILGLTGRNQKDGLMIEKQLTIGWTTEGEVALHYQNIKRKQSIQITSIKKLTKKLGYLKYFSYIYYVNNKR